MTNYSYETSAPAYYENQAGKQTQADNIYNAIRTFGGFSCLKQLESFTGLPQSTVAGRCNDLIRAEKIKYSGIVFYENRKRKRIVLMVTAKEI